ncbi:hypothetical protein EPO33_03455 [Patescibacteria group bacterium]|nr:MAG: hypothetical protein EPO33_03455 [Patescibacteria group bacterium]
MGNKNQTALDSLWFGKNGNVMESLLFAVFLFLFSFALATSPAHTFALGTNVIVGTADGIGRGYEMTIHRLDSNIAVLPEITAGMQREIVTRVEAMQARDQEAIRQAVAILQLPPTKLVRRQEVSITYPSR